MTKLPGSDDAINHFEANQTFILIWIGQNWVALGQSGSKRPDDFQRIGKTVILIRRKDLFYGGCLYWMCL